MLIETDKLHEECGVAAIYGHPEASKLAYLSLYALQHRGQESAGIASADGEKIELHKAMGLVADIFNVETLARVPGSLAIGHTRYSTTGDSALLNAQPIRVECSKGKIALAHNGNIVNAHEIRSHLEHQGSIFQTTSDTEVIVHLIARSKEETLESAMSDSLRRIEGAFSLVMLTPDRIFAARDPRGFRPLVMGRIKGQSEHHKDAIVFASETCAFDLIGAVYEREVKPGELIIVGPEGVHSRFYSTQQPLSSCIFEHVYFSRPDSFIFGRSVQQSRDAMGRQLALESPVGADIVIPIPDSGVTAAMGFSAESGIPIQFGLIRNHYVGRTFIEPEQRVRDFGVRLKLNPVRHVIEGKRVVLIDDSIVRGTTSRKLVRMMREAGAKQVHMRISCPPTISPCYYGVDTPTREELIASSNTPEQICKYLGADSLGYLSLSSLKQAVNDTENKFCTSCYTGVYPTDLVQLEVRESASNGKTTEVVAVERES